MTPKKKRWLLAGGICFALGLCAALLYFVSPDGAGIPCPVYLLTGFYCPGCGASRALRSLLHLQFYQAFRYNPALVLLLPFMIWYIAARLIDYVRTGGNHVDGRLSIRLLWWVLALLILYGIARNLPFFPFNLLRPTKL